MAVTELAPDPQTQQEAALPVNGSVPPANHRLDHKKLNNPQDPATTIAATIKKILSYNTDKDLNAGMGMLNSMLQATPELSEAAYDAAVPATHSSDPRVRANAQMVLGVVARDSIKPILRIDESTTYGIRKPNIQSTPAISPVPTSGPVRDLVPGVIESASAAMDDPDSHVRNSAIQNLYMSVTERPDLAGQALPSIQKALKDSDPNVRDMATVAYDSVIRLRGPFAFFQGNSASPSKPVVPLSPMKP